MNRFFISLALAAIFAGPVLAQDQSLNHPPSVPAEVRTEVGHTDNMTLGLMAGIGVIGAGFLIGLAVSNRA